MRMRRRMWRRRRKTKRRKKTGTLGAKQVVGVCV